MRTSSLLSLLLATVAHFAIAEDITPAQRYENLLAEYEQGGRARVFAKRFLAHAEQFPEDATAVDALVWVVKNVRGKPDTTRALTAIDERHVASAKLGDACGDIARSRSVAAEKLLRRLVDHNPNRDVQAMACRALAVLLGSEANIVEQLKSQPDLAPRVLQYYGKEYGDHLASLDADTLAKNREQTFEKMLDSFADIETSEGTLGEIAEKQLFRLRHLSVGKIAPNIIGNDIHGRPLKLSDYRGKVVMLTFWGHW